MKDYKLIKFVAKELALASSCGKTCVSCHFPYDKNSLLGIMFSFEKQQSRVVMFDLQNIYEVYAKNRFASCDAMVKTLVSRHTYFDTIEVDGRLLIISDLRVNRIDHVCSQALTNVSLIMHCLNELLNLSADCCTEEEWRAIHRAYLDKQRRKNSYIGGDCIGLFALSVASFILAIINMNGTWRLGGIVIRESHLAFFLIFLFVGIIGLIAGIIFNLKSRYFKSHIERSYNAKSFEG